MIDKFSRLFATALALGLSAPASHAAVYNFMQNGFYDAMTAYTGGVIQGSFVAEDGNSDGWITTPEVTGFSLVFSGDSIIPDFSLGFAELNILNFKIGSSFLGNNVSPPSLAEGIDAASLGLTGFSYRTGLGGLGFEGAMVQNIETFENVVSDRLAAMVPAPTVLWLLGAALPGFIGFSRTRKAA